MPRQIIVIALLLGAFLGASAAPVAARRRVESLQGEWQFRRADADGGWKSVTLPANFEEHEGIEFDGVGVYRKTLPRVTLPAGTRALLHFQAVATEAEVWFDGKLAGTGGDIEKKETAFEQRKSHLVTDLVTPGKTALIAVRVYDWYGAGGIFRPVTLGTVPLGTGAAMLQ